MKQIILLILMLVLITGCTSGKKELVTELKTLNQVQSDNNGDGQSDNNGDGQSDNNGDGQSDNNGDGQSDNNGGDLAQVQSDNKGEAGGGVPVELPKTINHDVAFASQAPFADWGLPYQEACEESALIIAWKYFRNEKLDNQIMDEEIKKVVEWQKEKFGLYSDTSLEEVNRIAKDYFKLNVEISEDVSVENMKKQLVAGYLVLTPTAGRELGNPNYSGQGPLYHFLVIRGYDRDQFITNDVGTRKGEGYKYQYNTIIKAIHDLPLNEDGSVFRPYDEALADALKQEKMLDGAKRILIVKGLE